MNRYNQLIFNMYIIYIFYIMDVSEELMNKYYDGLKKYYSAKQKYEKTDQTRCIHCKRKVGTIFSENKDRLIILCGSTEDPCELNMKIIEPMIIDIEKEYYETIEEMDRLTQEIKEIKLSYMFGYIDKDELESRLEDLKKAYTKLEEEHETFSILFNERIDNKDIKKEIISKEAYLYDVINTIKESIGEYIATGFQNTTFITDVVELYEDTIKPLSEEIRNLKYNTYNIQATSKTGKELTDKELEIMSNKKIYRLIRNTNNIKNNEIVLSKPEIRMNL